MHLYDKRNKKCVLVTYILRQLLVNVLRETQSVQQASNILNIPRGSLYYAVKQYNIKSFEWRGVKCEQKPLTLLAQTLKFQVPEWSHYEI